MNVTSKIGNFSLSGDTATDYLYAGARLPRISFIVVNYNYGRFLRQCVESIFGQTYPNIECIIVDNKSTDESSQVIADLKSDYPQLGVIYEAANLGQSAACIDGYNRSSGHFVVFVDADDYYFETFVETHFLVHLSLRQAVGFSSSDMVQVVDGAVVLGTVFEACGPFPKGFCCKVECDTSRVFPTAPDDSGFQPTVEINDLSLRSVSFKTSEWVWAPTSGTMYRRDALALFADCAAVTSLRCSTDAFFSYAINAFTGSVLIERPLAAYRIHGDNIFAKHASLNNLCCFDERTELASTAAKLALAHVVANLDRFAEKMWTPRQLMNGTRFLYRKASSKRWRRELRAILLAAMRLYWRLKLKTL